MSDEASSSTDMPAPAGDQGAPRVRRISNPRPKKPVKRAVSGEAADGPAESEASLRVEAPKVAKKFPEFATSDAEPEAAAAERGADEGGSDWSEAEPATVGGGSGQEGGKRKRRRKKGKGGGQQAANAPQAQPQAEQDGVSGDAPPALAGQQALARPPQQVQPQRPKVDAELLAKFAWKIYLAEVSEEGVALIADNDARELSRRCFRLAEIFLEEQSRRR